jgi:hypothetical protein
MASYVSRTSPRETRKDAEIIESILPQLTLIGPAAGAELRALVYG